jgi:hypothetical protein
MLPNAECLGAEGDVCCTSLYDIANHILAGVYEALLPCYSESFCNTGLLAYVTMGTGDDLVFDALTVSLGEVKTTARSVQNGIKQSPVASYTAEFNVRLIESGWPMAHEEGNQLLVPDPVLQNALARHSYAHGERMYRRLSYMASHGDVGTSACSAAMVTPLIPLAPLGGTVGWRTSVVLTLPGTF